MAEGKRPVILIVDDEAIVRRFIGMAIAQSSLKMSCDVRSPDGAEALDNLVDELAASGEQGNGHVEVIILDGQLKEWGHVWSHWQEELALLLGGQGLVIGTSSFDEALRDMETFFTGRCDRFVRLPKTFSSSALIDLIKGQIIR